MEEATKPKPKLRPAPDATSLVEQSINLSEREALLVLRGERTTLPARDTRPPDQHPIVFDGGEDEDPTLILVKNAIWELHLRGYNPHKIRLKLKLSLIKTKALLREVKQEMMEWVRDHPEAFASPMELVFEQIERRRERQSALWEEIEKSQMESVKPQYYRLIAEEDKAIEGLVGLDKQTLEVVFGSPMEKAAADLLKNAGPEGLAQILETIRGIHLEQTGSDIKTTSAQIVEGTVRELRSEPQTA